MQRYKIEVVENATNASNIMPETPLDKVVGDCMKDYLEYRKAEEQGLLLRLPCKVGDTVFDNDFGKTDAYRITGFSFGTAEDYIDEPVTENDIVFYYANPTGSITGSFESCEIGKTVFLTKEEAKKELERLNGNGEKL